MSATTSADSTSTPAPAGLTVDSAADNIAAILAREDGEPEEREEQPGEQPKADEAEADEADPPEEETPEEQPEEGGDEGAEDEEGAEDGEEETEEAPPEASTITVDIGGKAVTLTKDEVAKGYLRTEDYTRKTQALAEERKAFHQHAQAVTQERQQYAALLPALEQQIKSLLPVEPNWEELAAADPVEFNRQWAAKQLRDTKLQAIQSERARLAAMEQQQTAQQTEQQIAAERQRLVEANPRWGDPERWKQDRSAVRDYLAGYGYSADEISAVTDHRAVVIAHKARLYDEAVKKGVAPKAKQQQQQQAQQRPAAPAVAAPSRPGSAVVRRPVSELTRAKQRLAKTHSISDAASVIGRLI
jgi:hypothetical protein